MHQPNNIQQNATCQEWQEEMDSLLGEKDRIETILRTYPSNAYDRNVIIAREIYLSLQRHVDNEITQHQIIQNKKKIKFFLNDYFLCTTHFTIILLFHLYLLSFSLHCKLYCFCFRPCSEVILSAFQTQCPRQKMCTA